MNTNLDVKMVKQLLEFEDVFLDKTTKMVKLNNFKLFALVYCQGSNQEKALLWYDVINSD